MLTYAVRAVELEKLSFDVMSLIDTMINFPCEMDRWGHVTNESRPISNSAVLGDPFRIQQILKKFISFCSGCPSEQVGTVRVSVHCQVNPKFTCFPATKVQNTDANAPARSPSSGSRTSA